MVSHKCLSNSIHTDLCSKWIISFKYSNLRSPYQYLTQIYNSSLGIIFCYYSYVQFYVCTEKLKEDIGDMQFKFMRSANQVAHSVDHGQDFIIIRYNPDLINSFLERV